MSCKVVFVVLHFETLEDTKKCIDSLIKYFDNDKIQVIVVDNGSSNGKLIKIEPMYKKHNQIKFIYSSKNLGFAKGNNLGFLYAKNNFNPEIIVLANNDLIFKQENFIDYLIKAKNIEKFDVAGPRIISLNDSKNQNPVCLVYHKSKEVETRINKFRILKLLSYFNLDIKLKKILGKPIEEYELIPGEDFQLHGACMFFANNYLKMYDGLYDGTFMYGEEFILKYIVQKNKMKMSYLDNLIVYHKEGSSTKKLLGKGKKQRQFFYRWSIKSLNQLKIMMKTDESDEAKI